MSALRNAMLLGFVGAVTTALYVGAPPAQVQAETGNVARLHQCVARAQDAADLAVADRATDRCLQEFALAENSSAQ